MFLQWITLILILIGVFGVGYYVRNRIFDLKVHIYIDLAISWIIGFFVSAALCAPLLFLSKFEYSGYLLVFIALAGLYPGIQLLKKFLQSNFSMLGLITLFVLILVFSQAKEFNLLWDARSSWFLKSQSFFYEGFFPNKLFLSSETSNIVKDYPIWHSVFFGALSRSIGEYSDLFNKFTQSITSTLWISVFYIMVREYVKNIFVKSNQTIISSIIALLVMGNYKFLEWLKSGYVDIFMSLIMLICGYLLVKISHNKDNKTTFNYIGLISFTTTGLLLKNEGISLLIAVLLPVSLYFFNKEKLKDFIYFFNKNNIMLIGLIFFNYIFWFFVKKQHGYTSDLIGGVQSNTLNEYIYHAFRLITLIYNDLIYARLWNYTLWVLFIIFITTMILVVIQIKDRIIKKPNIYPFLFVTILSFFFVLAYIITPEKRFDFFYMVTFDRVVLQFLPVSVIVYLYYISNLKTLKQT